MITTAHLEAELSKEAIYRACPDLASFHARKPPAKLIREYANIVNVLDNHRSRLKRRGGSISKEYAYLCIRASHLREPRPPPPSLTDFVAPPLTLNEHVDTSVSTTAAAVEGWRDWKNAGLVEVYDQGALGQGIRATRLITFNTDVLSHSIAAFLDGRPLTPSEVEAKRNVTYVINTSLSEETPRLLDLEHHWTGKINHAPPRSCNMRFEGLTLVQAKEINAGEALLVDYGCQYWVHQITGVDYSHWETMGDEELLEAFERMHAIVDDYSALLSERLSQSQYQTDPRALLRRLKQLVPGLVKRRARKSITGHKAKRRQRPSPIDISKSSSTKATLSSPQSFSSSSLSPTPSPASPETRQMRRHWAKYVASMAGQPTLPQRFPHIFRRSNPSSSPPPDSVAVLSSA